VDLVTLIGQFVALRQEVNLQTRASRGQLEQNAQALEKLGQALATLEQQQTLRQRDSQEAQEEILRPLLRTLIDLFDALSLARREVQRVQDAIVPLLDQLTTIFSSPSTTSNLPPPPQEFPVPWWVRLLGLQKPLKGHLASYHEWWENQQKIAAAQQQILAQQQQQGEEQAQTLTVRIRQAVGSILTGYAMSLHGLEPIPALGQPFDPETMEVLEAVAGSGRPAGEVLEEIRRGYFWQGRIFRFAQVKVARS
jgi:molecular chaperone GrpE